MEERIARLEKAQEKLESSISAISAKQSAMDKVLSDIQAAIGRQGDSMNFHFQQEESQKDQVNTISKAVHEIQLSLAGLPATQQTHMREQLTPLWNSFRTQTEEYKDDLLAMEKCIGEIPAKVEATIMARIFTHMKLVWGAAIVFYSLGAYIFTNQIEEQEKHVAEYKRYVETDRLFHQNLNKQISTIVREHATP